MRLHSIGFVLAVIATACATAGQAPPTTNAPTSNATGRETFSADQLSSTAAANVFDALTTLKPEILTGRGRGVPDVYVGTVKQPTGLDRLKELSLFSVREVTYLRYHQARTLTDAQSPGGADRRQVALSGPSTMTVVRRRPVA